MIFMRKGLYPPSQKDSCPKETQEARTETDDTNTQTGKGAEGQNRSYPQRERRRPQYLEDYECKVQCDDQKFVNIDYCYRVMCNVPNTFKEAMNSAESKLWTDAMQEEMNSLKENDTFTLTTLPEGKNAVGGRSIQSKTTQKRLRYIKPDMLQRDIVKWQE